LKNINQPSPRAADVIVHYVAMSDQDASIYLGIGQ